MKLKSLMVCAGLLAFTSCANQVEAFTIAKFYPLGKNCDPTANIQSIIAANGYLDVAAGKPQFFVGIRMVGAEKLKQPAVNVGGIELERANRNLPIVNQQVVTYRLSKKVGAAPKPYLTNLDLPFTDKGEVFGAFQLISPELGLALETLAPSPGTAPSNTIENDFVDISADVEFKGEFSADRHPFTTGVLTFPIRAYRSLPVDCGTAGYTRFRGGGPDGGTPDPCDYAGQTTSQLAQPAPPSCCISAAGGC